MKRQKFTINKKLLSQLLDKVQDENLEMEITVGETRTDANGDKETDILVESEDSELFNKTIENIINTIWL